MSVGDVSEERLKEGDLGASLSGGMLSKLRTTWHENFYRNRSECQDWREGLKLITCKVHNADDVDDKTALGTAVITDRRACR